MTAEGHDAIRKLLAVHALDALEAAEAAVVEEHVSGCPDCRAELDQHRAVAALIGAQAVEADVPDSLWSRVRHEISSTRPTPLRPRSTTFLLTATAAAAMLVVAVVQTSRLASAHDELVVAQARITAIEAATSVGDWSEVAAIAAGAPGSRSVELNGEGIATVTLLPDGTGFVTAAELEELPAERSYQLWIVQRGEAVSAGLLRRGVAGSTFRYDPSTLQGLVVTEEDAAGVVVSDGPAVSAWFGA
ncbi:MAG TPA: anti-sigma factor [Acidimicrobiia bacterium]|nr:anti-sigma factor [Acidimicrobiia bacterium]